MAGVRRIFVIGDFRDEDPRAVQLQQRMWIKGLLRQGLDVFRFSYRNILLQCSPFGGKKIALRVAKGKCDRVLMKQIRSYCPDIVLILLMKYLDAETARQIRQAAPNALLIGRDEDPYPEKNAARLAIARQTDMVLTTGAGAFLQTYKKAGVPRCVFVPNACDPDIQYRYTTDPSWHIDVLFTGHVAHSRHTANDERQQILSRLAQMPNARIYGSANRPRVDGLDYFYAISGAKTALSINIVNDVRLYHSDRLINYISCGTLALARRVPDTELLWQDSVHLRYFDTPAEFFDLVRYYLGHDQERQRIADGGMEYAHREFNCIKLAAMLIDLVDKGRYEAPWAEMV